MKEPKDRQVYMISTKHTEKIRCIYNKRSKTFIMAEKGLKCLFCYLDDVTEWEPLSEAKEGIGR